MIATLMKITLQSGILITALQIAALVTYLKATTSWADFPVIFISKVYSITLLACLARPRDVIRNLTSRASRAQEKNTPPGNDIEQAEPERAHGTPRRPWGPKEIEAAYQMQVAAEEGQFRSSYWDGREESQSSTRILQHHNYPGAGAGAGAGAGGGHQQEMSLLDALGEEEGVERRPGRDEILAYQRAIISPVRGSRVPPYPLDER